ncbi:hypothetical protein AB1Y20_007785 [Prymnesium parvum]|uniref:DNA replication licensing factor MCM2 n=1 Tax=Prymnesium parvum TaxID=97485 RepID=A0AB34IRX3_PRYPA
MPPAKKQKRAVGPSAAGGGGPGDDSSSSGSSPPVSAPGSPDSPEPENEDGVGLSPEDNPNVAMGADEEDDGEDLLGEDMMADYRRIDALDAYEEDGLDDNDYGDIDFDARAAAEAALEERDLRERASRIPAALLASDDEDDERPERRRARRRQEAEDGAEEDPAAGIEELLDDDESGINLEDYHGPLAEWITSPAVSEEIKRRFRRFLTKHDGSGAEQNHAPSRYAERVRAMCAANSQSLEVSYLHLSHAVPILAIWVADCPKEMLQLLSEAAMEAVRIMFPNYREIHEHVLVRITELPIHDSIRDLRQVHMGCLVKVSGVVTRRSAVFPQLKICKYNCLSCGYILGPYTINGGGETKMQGVHCPSCHNKGPYALNAEQTVYCNYQKVTLQESPGSVPAGRLPRHKEVVLQFDLIDVARPGEEIEVTGIYTTNFDASLNRRSGFPVFSTMIEANHVLRKEELLSSRMLTDEDKKEIIKLSKDPALSQKIISSIAPSIWGHEDIKTCLALSMFGGVGKDVNGKHRIRGDINVLLLGDPGTAKSQFLKYIEKTAPRAVYTTGQGASAVGLTAAVRKDPSTGEWTLEGGALVLADKGVCLIDEFDKMNDSDRTSIHEAMEQQSISISKAGIITTLQARCSVVAAANPIKGRYDSALSFAENVDLTQPILSRFDCICVVKDTVDPITDERLAEFVVNSHRRSHPHADASEEPAAMRETETILEQPLLRKYIMYARQHIKPVLQDIDDAKIQKVYAELRQESSSGGVAVAVRHIESIIRMAEASARMHLREYVTESDVDLAISVLLTSVIKSQKYAVARQMDVKFRKYLVRKQDANELLLFKLRTLFHDAASLGALRRAHDADPDVAPVLEVDVEEFESKAREMRVFDLDPFYKSALFTGGKEPRHGFRKMMGSSGWEVIIRASDLDDFAKNKERASARGGDDDAPSSAHDEAEGWDTFEATGDGPLDDTESAEAFEPAVGSEAGSSPDQRRSPEEAAGAESAEFFEPAEGSEVSSPDQLGSPAEAEGDAPDESEG